METSGWAWYREADDAHARDDNARLRAILGHCPTCIAVLDEDGLLVGYNAEFTSLFPTPPVIGEPVAHLFDERPRAMLAEVVALAGTRRRAAALISATPGTVTLCISDDGIGIEPSRLVDSFEAFETTRAARGGTGLGLAIAREIVEAAGGHIDVLSTPGYATEMRLELPTAPRASS
jgi:hypothetical protein